MVSQWLTPKIVMIYHQILQSLKIVMIHHQRLHWFFTKSYIHQQLQQYL